MADALPVQAQETEYTDTQGITYSLKEDLTCNIKSCTAPSAAKAAIPETVSVSGTVYRVSGIGKGAFDGASFKQLDIPNSIRSIKSGAFDGCKKLSVINVIPNDAPAKKSGKSAVLTIRVSEALFSTSAGVRLSIPKNVMKQAAAIKKTDTAALIVSIVDNPYYDVKNAGFDRIVLEKDAVRTAAGGRDFKASVKNPEGSIYFVKAKADQIKQLSGSLDITLKEQAADAAAGTLKSDLKKAMKKNGISAGRVKVLGFTPVKNTRVNVDVIFPAAPAKAKSSMYIYCYNQKKRVFEAVSFQPQKVSGQGNLTLSVSKGGQYIVTNKKLNYMCTYPASQFIQESGSIYYVDKKGAVVKGWRKIGSEYYYFDRKSGKQAFGRTQDSVQILKNGTAKKTAANVSRIQTMIKARSIVEQITKPADSKSEKIRKCFLWIFQFPYHRYRRLKPIYRQPGWEVTFANDIFDRHQGCCVSEAAAAAFLFHECGYETVYVACDTGHAWVELNGRVYDPLFAEARGFAKYYNISYGSYGLHAVLKRKI